MSKYIDSEKLIAEIERRVEEYNIQSLRGAELSDLLSFITSLQQGHPSLPSNIDEAAEKYSENILANNEDLQDAIEDAFKEGAKWMAEQGATCNGEIQMDFSEPDDIYARRLSADYWNELGPALMKVEPGKVLIQVRKKQ